MYKMKKGRIGFWPSVQYMKELKNSNPSIWVKLSLDKGYPARDCIKRPLKSYMIQIAPFLGRLLHVA